MFINYALSTNMTTLGIIMFRVDCFIKIVWELIYFLEFILNNTDTKLGSQIEIVSEIKKSFGECLKKVRVDFNRCRFSSGLVVVEQNNCLKIANKTCIQNFISHFNPLSNPLFNPKVCSFFNVKTERNGTTW